MDNKLAHRDDLPMDVVAELEEHFSKLYPGYKVVFAGDAPADQQLDMADIFEALSKRIARSFADGTCVDCNAIMPYYEPENPDWLPHKGWGKFTDISSGEFGGWQCCDCSDKDGDGKPRPVNID